MNIANHLIQTNEISLMKAHKSRNTLNGLVKLNRSYTVLYESLRTLQLMLLTGGTPFGSFILRLCMAQFLIFMEVSLL